MFVGIKDKQKHPITNISINKDYQNQSKAAQHIRLNAKSKRTANTINNKVTSVCNRNPVPIACLEYGLNTKDKAAGWIPDKLIQSARATDIFSTQAVIFNLSLLIWEFVVFRSNTKT